MDNIINPDMQGGNEELNYQEPKFLMYSGHDMTLALFEIFLKSLWIKNKISRIWFKYVFRIA